MPGSRWHWYARSRWRSRSRPRSSQLVTAITGGGLTAAAGIAYVKPHHPFSAAYGLAEELTASAKRWKRAAGREVSSLDLHVAFESTLTDLAGLRAPPGGRADSPRYGGPYVITSRGQPAGGTAGHRRAGPCDGGLYRRCPRPWRTTCAKGWRMGRGVRPADPAGRPFR